MVGVHVATSANGISNTRFDGFFVFYFCLSKSLSDHYASQIPGSVASVHQKYFTVSGHYENPPIRLPLEVELVFQCCCLGQHVRETIHEIFSVHVKRVGFFDQASEEI